MDDFQCLGDLARGRQLDIQCLTKAPQKPDVSHRKRLEEAMVAVELVSTTLAGAGQAGESDEAPASGAPSRSSRVGSSR